MPEVLSPSVEVRLHRCVRGTMGEVTDYVAAEEPLEIRVRGRSISITMRTPGHDADLAAGFLLTEGVICRRNDIEAIDPCEREGAGSVLNVRLAADVAVDFGRLTRHVFASSSCGVCGKATIESLSSIFPPIDSTLTIAAEVLIKLPARMRESQATFEQTGGLHAAALFDENGDLLILREDVGRHNAVDKVIGYALMAGVDAGHLVLVVSGRTSFEIMQKALAARVPIVAAVSAPSSLACEMAAAKGQTLIGFLRNDRMNIYAGAQRIVGVLPATVTL